MPVWQQKIKEIASPDLLVLGVVQEQHAERARLYKQWKQYDFPVAQDPITKLGAAVVPIFVGIDEYGIVRNTRLRPKNLESFLAKKFDAPETTAPVLVKIDYAGLAADHDSIEAQCMAGDQELLFPLNKSESCDKAIAAYRKALELDPENGTILFRMGTAYRKRYDEHSHDDADFDQASRYWTLALQSNPRQYIWRRRIEQYGPRLQKPYPFYDWVATAIEEIEGRGETPVKLTVELTQSELADRSKTSYANEDSRPESTEGVEQDDGTFVRINSTMVPGYVKAGQPATVHLRLVPTGAKWNNESKPLTIWIESDAVKLSKQLLTFDNPGQAESTEDRSLEFDLLADNKAGDRSITGFALYYVCTEDGVCMYRRQDFEIAVPQAHSTK